MAVKQKIHNSNNPSIGFRLLEDKWQEIIKLGYARDPLINELNTVIQIMLKHMEYHRIAMEALDGLRHMKLKED